MSTGPSAATSQVIVSAENVDTPAYQMMLSETSTRKINQLPLGMTATGMRQKFERLPWIKNHPTQQLTSLSAAPSQRQSPAAWLTMTEIRESLTDLLPTHPDLEDLSWIVNSTRAATDTLKIVLPTLDDVMERRSTIASSAFSNLDHVLAEKFKIGLSFLEVLTEKHDRISFALIILHRAFAKRLKIAFWMLEIATEICGIVVEYSRMFLTIA
ncbi:hypothetical protein BKA61DRAFT_692952 [Leptodontidium sp. MPI-SDFR-AT-0119]|nr:hypothetical protein BKA61DRAFT_692952 [Leptodontidium sp. MPI-SDFR-AT-0119]